MQKGKIYGENSTGIGITTEEFYLRKEGKGSGHLSGHVGFAESVGMIADGIGWDVAKFTQDMEPIVTDVDRKSPYGFAAAGNVAGVAMKAWGYDKDGQCIIEMDHPQQIEPEQVGVKTGDYVIIKGTPNVNMVNSPEIDGGIGKAEIQDEPAPQANAPAIVDFQPYMGKVRKPGTGYISQINDHLFEGRYSPTWIDGKKHARNVYAHTREECEEKLKVLIAEMKAELAELKRQKGDRH